MKKQQAYHNWFLTAVGLEIKKVLDLLPRLPNHAKYFLKVFAITISIS